MLDQTVLEEGQLYAVQLNGLHSGLKMKFSYKEGTDKWEDKPPYRQIYKTANFSGRIDQIKHSGKSVSLTIKIKRKNPRYWESAYTTKSMNVPLDAIVTIDLKEIQK